MELHEKDKLVEDYERQVERFYQAIAVLENSEIFDQGDKHDKAPITALENNIKVLKEHILKPLKEMKFDETTGEEEC